MTNWQARSSEYRKALTEDDEGLGPLPNALAAPANRIPSARCPRTLTLLSAHPRPHNPPDVHSSAPNGGLLRVSKSQGAPLALPARLAGSAGPLVGLLQLNGSKEERTLRQ